MLLLLVVLVLTCSLFCPKFHGRRHALDSSKCCDELMHTWCTLLIATSPPFLPCSHFPHCIACAPVIACSDAVLLHCCAVSHSIETERRCDCDAFTHAAAALLRCQQWGLKTVDDRTDLLRLPHAGVPRLPHPQDPHVAPRRGRDLLQRLRPAPQARGWRICPHESARKVQPPMRMSHIMTVP